MEYPTVSVLTPTYNRKDFIELCIFNLKNQLYPLDKLEWFVLDDSPKPYTKGEQKYISDSIKPIKQTHRNILDFCKFCQHNFTRSQKYSLLKI